jgi:hypothetical protein
VDTKKKNRVQQSGLMGSTCSAASSANDSIINITPPSPSIRRPTPPLPPDAYPRSKPEKGPTSPFRDQQNTTPADVEQQQASQRRLSVSKGPTNNTSNSNLPASTAKEMDFKPSQSCHPCAAGEGPTDTSNHLSFNHQHQQPKEAEPPTMTTFLLVGALPNEKHGRVPPGHLASSGSSKDGGATTTHTVLVPRNHRVISDSNKNSFISPLSADRLEDWYRDE